MNGWDDDFDIFPDATADETELAWGEDPQEPDDDQRPLDERPPHWS